VPADLRRLAVSRRLPLLLLSDGQPQSIAECFDCGVSHWLPRQQTLTEPTILLAALRQAARQGDLRRRLQRRRDALGHCRQRVNRLTDMLWQTATPDPHMPWLSQLQVQTRLLEEVERSRRHQYPLSVVLAELDASKRPTSDQAWYQRAAQLVNKNKRASDFAGQYGLNGFILALPHTPCAGAVTCCRRLKPLLERPTTDALRNVDAWFGIGSLPTNDISLKGLLCVAERKLQDARHRPFDSVAF